MLAFRDELEKWARRKGLIKKDEHVSVMATADCTPTEVMFRVLGWKKRDFGQTPMSFEKRILFARKPHPEKDKSQGGHR